MLKVTKLIKFGPSGNSNSFYEQGYKHTYEAAEYLKRLNLDVFEYSFGRGVNIKSETAQLIGKKFKDANIEISVHAPYYINFANTEIENIDKSINYVMQSCLKLLDFGGSRCVFHPGTCGKLNREDAVNLILKNTEKLIEAIYSSKLNDKVILCPETMGKLGQIGTTEEILEICKLDKIFIPTFDFGHINSREQGSLKTKEDYKRIIDKIYQAIGKERAEKIHIHFSKIEYGKSGEIRHLTFGDEIYGPLFEPLAEVIAEYKMSPVIICESDGTQAEDAANMKNYYNSLI